MPEDPTTSERDSVPLPRVEIHGEAVLTGRGDDTHRSYWTAHLIGPGGRYLIIGLNGRADVPTPTVIVHANQVAEVLACPVVIQTKMA
jgi:hypothetical protein